MSDPFQYPGDDVMCKALGEALKKARLEAGLSIEEAEERSRVAMEGLDRKRISRALGLAIKEAREKRHVSRKELSRSAGLPLRRLIAIERGLARDMPVTEFFRISYALKMKPDELTERFEEIEKNIEQGAIDRE
jgi:transcriptional regulator with XRE-family HTH domain